MKNNTIISEVFDQSICDHIIEFSNCITDSDADLYIVMARKAACFIRILQKYGLLTINGELVTERILDFDRDWLYGKRVVIIDDVIVSGTTIYTTIQTLKQAGAIDIKAYVLGINTDYCNVALFDYHDEYGEKKNYMQSPYLLLPDAECVRMCANIVTLFALDSFPYDVDFPKHSYEEVTEAVFNQIVRCSDWRAYDVSSDIQVNHGIKNITLIPTSWIEKLYEDRVGIPITELGFFKIRIFAKYNPRKKKPYRITAVPFFLFNEISADDVQALFAALALDIDTESLHIVAKIRLLQYILAEELFYIWKDTTYLSTGKQLDWELDKASFCLVFPRSYWNPIVAILKSPLNSALRQHKFSVIELPDINHGDSNISIIPTKYNGSVLQTKLIEPFTALYNDKEKLSREIVFKYGADAFTKPEYQQIINRLNHGYSYRWMTSVISESQSLFDKETVVSLFIDEAIDAGIIVPIIAEETDATNNTYFCRAYRHGEDVPFGELEEKECSILLSNYCKIGGTKALSKLRVEKMLVLFLQIGENQHLFRLNSHLNTQYYVNVDAYLMGNIPTVERIESGISSNTSRNQRFLTYKSDAIWLTQVLEEKGILVAGDESSGYTEVRNTINVPIDPSVTGKIEMIGKTFGQLYVNSTKKQIPYITDSDLVLFTTCLKTTDIVNALAAELNIFCDRWRRFKQSFKGSGLPSSSKILELRQQEIYHSINSGQDKFFSFWKKEPLKRIQEIEEQLRASPEFTIYESIWKQFWPGTLNWDSNSLEQSQRFLILKEGFLLVCLNLFTRLLFLSQEEILSQKVELTKQCQDYLNKLAFREFPYKQKAKDYISLADSVIMESKSKVSSLTIQRIIDTIDNAVLTAKSALDDATLITDRHGKVNTIIRYSYVVYLRLPEDRFSGIRAVLYSEFSKIGINPYIIPIAKSSILFPACGIYVFFRSCKITSLLCAIKRLGTTENQKKYGINEIRVFYSLSENLKLKTTPDGNQRIRNGQFPSYISAINTAVGISNPPSMRVYWIIENSKSNRKEISVLTGALNPNFQIVHRYEVQLGSEITVDANESIVLETRLSSDLEIKREEYKKMERKTVFVSYTDDTPEHLNRITHIVNRMRDEGFDVLFFEDAPLGTDMARFMRSIKRSDVVILVGSEKYKEKGEQVFKSGVSFEDGILVREYMSNEREKIVPISFGSFDETIPSPYNTLKGMKFSEELTDEELDIFVRALINKVFIMEHSNP